MPGRVQVDNAADFKEEETFALSGMAGPSGPDNVGSLEGDLWQQAAVEVNWKPPPGLNVKTSNTLGSLNSLYQHGCNQMARKDNRLLNLPLRGGKAITFRDMWGKVLIWVERFKSVGDIAVQADAGYASLPWALVRLILTAAVSENSTGELMLDSMEYISHLITQYHVIEQAYAIESSELAISLQRSLISFYASILQYLVYHTRFLDKSSFKQFLKRSIPTSFEEIKTLLGTINDNKDRVDADAFHMNSELTRHGFDVTQQGQKHLISQQQRLIDSQQILVEGQVRIESQHVQIQKRAEERVSQMQDILREWLDDFHHLHNQVSEIYFETVESANVNRILDWLSPIRQEIYHAAAQKDVIEGSGRWLLEHPEFRDWQESAQSSILWMHGYLGTGKTKLVSIVIETLLSISENSMQAERLTYFYCSRNEAGAENSKTASSREEPVEVLRSLTKQLVKYRSGKGLDNIVTYKYSLLKGSDMEEPRRLSIRECIELIVSFAKDSPITIVVDALDECRHATVRELTQSFEEIVRSSRRRVKIFFSTRNVSAVVDNLKQYNWPSLEVSADKNGGDIARFIDIELNKRIEDKSLLHGDVSRSLKAEIRGSLSQRTGSMFWYASLQLNLLCDPTAEQDETNIRQKLSESPTSLTDAYVQIIHEINDLKNSRKSRTVAYNAMVWLLCAQKPLSCEGFLKAVGDDCVDRDFVIRVCRSLVVEDKANDVFEFAHLSVREFLEQSPEFQQSERNLVAAERCIGMVDASFLSSQINQENHPSQNEFEKYAFLYWPLHYQSIDLDHINDRKETLRNKLKNLLVWSSDVSPVFKQWISTVKTLGRGPEQDQSLSMKLESLQAFPGEPHTPLFTACVFGFADLIGQFRRSKRIDFDQCNIQRQTALCLAVENNQLETVRSLLSDLPRSYSPPIDVNLVNHWALVQFEELQSDSPLTVIIYASALQAAAAKGHTALLRYLLAQGARVDLVAGVYGSALQAAALNGHDDLVQMLLDEFEAEPNSQGGLHGNALQAAASSNNVRSVAHLIDHGALASAPGGHFGSALMAGVCCNNIDIVELLLQQNANVNVRSAKYGTPLEKAADLNSKDILRRLIASGADINAGTSSHTGDHKIKSGSALATAAYGGHSKIVSILLEHGAHADTKTHGKAFHLLHQAAHRGMVDLLEYCLDQKGCNIDLITNEGERYFSSQRNMSPLSFACVEGHAVVVDFLLSRGASLEFEDDAATTLLLAAHKGHSQIIKQLIRHSRDRNGPYETQRFIDRCLPETDQSALHEAALSNSVEAVDTLLSEGAKYHSNGERMSPLHISAIQNRQEIANLLMTKHRRAEINGDFSIDARDKDGKTSLIKAVEYDSTTVIFSLLEGGANPFVSDPSGNSALHHAVAWNSEEIIELMLARQSKENLPNLLDKRNDEGNTALMEAVKRQHWGLIKLLLRFGAQWHADDGQETSFHLAARRDETLVKDYLDAFEGSGQTKALLASWNMYKRTALHSAAEWNQPRILRTLLEAGADVMALEDKSRTALFWAVERNHTKCAKILLEFAEKNLDKPQLFIDHRNIWGKPALHEAIHRRNLSSVELLLEYKADITSCGSNHNETALTLTAQDELNCGYDNCVLMAKTILAHAKKIGQLQGLINSSNSKQHTCLWEASNNNLPDLVSLLLNNGADYSIFTLFYNVTPLHRACWLNHQEVAEILLHHSSKDPDQAKFGAFLNQVDYWGRTALNAAAAQGNAEIVSLLLNEYAADYSISCPAENVPEQLFTPLHYTVSRGFEKSLAVLLRFISHESDRAKAKTFLDARHSQNRRPTALMEAALKSKPLMMEMLLKAGAEYSLTDDNKITALHCAICHGSLAVLETLLNFLNTESDKVKVESFLNAKNRFGKTGLMDAAERNLAPKVKRLIEAPNLDYTLQDNYGRTALHWCAELNNHEAALAILQFVSRNSAKDGQKFRKFLDQQQSKPVGHTALFSAVEKGHLDLTKILLERYHADWDVYDHDGSTPLHVATSRDNLPVAKVYLAVASENKGRDGGRFDAFLNRKNGNGRTALEMATEENNGRFMKALKEYGAR